MLIGEFVLYLWLFAPARCIYAPIIFY